MLFHLFFPLSKSNLSFCEMKGSCELSSLAAGQITLQIKCRLQLENL